MVTVTSNFRQIEKPYVKEIDITGVTSAIAGAVIITLDISEIAHIGFGAVVADHSIDYVTEVSFDGTNFTGGVMNGTAVVGTNVDDYDNLYYRYLRISVQDTAPGDHGTATVYLNLRSVA